MDGYLDAASTEPLHPRARAVLLSAVDDGWADPARLYGAARQARILLDRAREIVAAELGARPDEIAFTGSGTAAVHTGVAGVLRARRRHRRVVVGAVEHSAVFAAADWATADTGSTGQPSEGADAPDPVVRVGVDPDGRVDAAGFADAARGPGVALACLQAANHEVGTRQPVADVAGRLAGSGVPLLVDAAVVAGREPVPAGWDLLAASAHKWGGPAGVGVLAVRTGTRFAPPWPVDERSLGGPPGLEVGMLDLPAILAAAAALQARSEEAVDLDARQRGWTDELRRSLAGVADAQVVGHPTERVAHLVTVSFFGVDGEALVQEMDRAGLAVSSGSSCTASTLEPSHVLVAMGVLTHGNVRISLPRTATRDDVAAIVAALPPVVDRVRGRHSGVGAGGSTPVAGVAGDNGAGAAGAAGGALVLDCREMPCPAPVIALARAVAAAELGASVSVEADDPAAPADVAAFARLRGHTYLGVEPAADGVARITVRREV